MRRVTAWRWEDPPDVQTQNHVGASDACAAATGQNGELARKKHSRARRLEREI